MPTLLEAKDKVRSLSIKAYNAAIDTEMTTAEKKSILDAVEPEIKTWEKEVQDLEGFEKIKTERKAFLAAAGETGSAVRAEINDDERRQYPVTGKSLGQQFVSSKSYKDLKSSGERPGSWSTGSIELKTAVTEGTTGTPGPGYSFVQTPTVLPGITQTLFQPLTVEALFPSGTTSSPMLRYLVETAVTNAAATVAELGLKPESALTFAKVDEVLKKIATFLPVSDEMLEDYEQIQSYIDARLMLFVQLQAEVQLLRGDGTGTNLVGILNRTGLAPTVAAKNAAPGAGFAVAPYLSPTSDNDMDAVYRQITQVRVTSFLEPETIVMDPASWMNIQLSKNSQGSYYATGPFMGIGAQPSIWGKPVVPTTAMPAGTALVGAFRQAAQVFSKGGLTVEASNSHADYFQRNEVAIRAERRLLLACYRPSAFGVISGL